MLTFLLIVFFAAETLGKTVLEVAKLELEFQRPGGSPTDMLLTNWGHTNATVEMLVSHLLRAGLRYAAEKLRGLGLCYKDLALTRLVCL